MDYTSPISHIKVPIEIEAKFLNEQGDKFQYYRGTITKLHSVQENDRGKFVECDVIYDDGDEVYHTIFNEADFESDDDDSWRFADGSSSKIIKMLAINSKDIQDLKENVRLLLQKTIFNLHEDEDDDEEDEDEEDEEDEDDDEEDEDDDEEEDEDDESNSTCSSDEEIYDIAPRGGPWLMTFFSEVFIGIGLSVFAKVYLYKNVM